eukprot:COSAG03_NODE_9481_length_716_cov_0.860616_1_plen_36_part_10
MHTWLCQLAGVGRNKSSLCEYEEAMDSLELALSVQS